MKIKDQIVFKAFNRINALHSVVEIEDYFEKLPVASRVKKRVEVNKQKIKS